MAFLKFLFYAAVSLLWIVFLVFLCILSLAFESEALLISATAASTVNIAIHTVIGI